MAFSSYLDNQLINHVLGSGTYTKPSSLYVALFVGDPAGSGTEVSTSGTAYSRQSAAFTVASNAASNTANLEWSAATSSWGTITHVAIYDAATSGNQLVTAALANSKTVNTGDIIRVNAGNLTVTLT
jgi:4-hydroxy-L-threonine phosphate dehydrogenase PdxA